MRYQFLRFPGGKPKAVTLSYDDGPVADRRFSDTITKYGLKCTFNLNSDELRPNNNYQKEKLQEIYISRGHEIAVHGAWHRAEGTLRPIEGIRDVLDCRLELEEKLDMIIRGMAYPDSGITYFTNNANYESVKAYLKSLDIKYARTLGGDNNLFALPEDWYAWMPTAHHKNPKILEYIEEFTELDVSPKVYGARRQPRLFYLWGHSYEFDSDFDNNWELLEQICEKLSGNDEAWYATNGEIYDYVQAYNSLSYSADGTIIYNPTLFEIWFDVDGKLYSIKSGETIRL